MPGRANTFRALEEASIRLASLREARQTLILVGAGLGGVQDPKALLELHEILRLLKQNNTSVSVIDSEG